MGDGDWLWRREGRRWLGRLSYIVRAARLLLDGHLIVFVTHPPAPFAASHRCWELLRVRIYGF